MTRAEPGMKIHRAPDENELTRMRQSAAGATQQHAISRPPVSIQTGVDAPDPSEAARAAAFQAAARSQSEVAAVFIQAGMPGYYHPTDEERVAYHLTGYKSPRWKHAIAQGIRIGNV